MKREGTLSFKHSPEIVIKDIKTGEEFITDVRHLPYGIRDGSLVSFYDTSILRGEGRRLAIMLRKIH